MKKRERNKKYAESGDAKQADSVLKKGGKAFYKWTHTLSFKMFIQTSLVLVFFSFVVVLFVQLFISAYQSARSRAFLEQETELIIERLEDAYYGEDEPKLDEDGEEIEPLTTEEKLALLQDELAVMARTNDQKIFLLHYVTEDAEREVFYPVENADEAMREYEQMWQDFKTVSSANDKHFFIMEYLGVNYSVYKAEYISEDYGIYTIEVQENQTRTTTVAAGATSLMRNIVLIGMALSLIWSFWYAGSFTRPIKQMSKVTKSMSALNFEHRCMITSADELGDLAVNINDMSDKLKEFLQELKEKNEQLTAELEKAHKLDEMRKKFVSDVSHELKTPLSIISGYSEAIQIAAGKGSAESLGKAARYSVSIIEESKKMERLVHDLLNLSQYESGNYALTLSEVDIKKLAEDVLAGFSRLLEENNVTLKVKLQKAAVCADSLRLAQVITNYVGNAINHVSGERIISVKGKATGGKYRLSVENTGENIFEEDKERIWTSFYRADKSRQREQGRFGIGLSIVRALVELHGGTYGVNNTDGGVEFFFTVDLMTAE